jgi:integrase/recombinase XerD
MTTISDALSAYLTQLDADGRSMHTRAQVRRHVLLLGRWLAAHEHPGDVESLSAELLAQFLVSPDARARPDGSAKKATTTNALRTSLRCFCAHLHAAGVIAVNPARLVRRARCSPPPPKPLSAIEIERLLAAIAAGTGEAARRDHVLFSLLAGTGLRVGSVVAARVEDLDLEQGLLLVRTSKGDQPGRVFVRRDLVELLAAYLGKRRAGPLFLGAHGGALSTRCVAWRLACWAKRVGIQGGAGPHRLRHSFGTRLLEQTGDLALVQRALLHRSVLSTMAYVSVADARLRAAVGG